MVEEALLEAADSGLTPATDGWFVVNAREAAWLTNDAFGARCVFEADTPVVRNRPELEPRKFADVGFTLAVIAPGQPSGLYHAESVQEDFLILTGECVLIVEDEERQLRAWDFVHCPPGTGHAFVATGDGPCVIVATGNRREDLERIYRRSETALRHGASVEADTPNPTRHGEWRVERPPRWDELPWSGSD